MCVCTRALVVRQVPQLAEPNPHTDPVRRRADTLQRWNENKIPADTDLATLRRMYSEHGVAAAGAATAATARRQLPPIAMDRTRREFRKIFLPRNVNFAGNVFGGDFLQWMEVGRLSMDGFRIATSSHSRTRVARVPQPYVSPCAGDSTGWWCALSRSWWRLKRPHRHHHHHHHNNNNMFFRTRQECARLCAGGFADWPKFVTLNMSQVFFKAPVQMGDVVELEAEVVFATTHTVHVQTRVKIHRNRGVEGTEILDDSHSGTFVCLCIHDGEDGDGKRPVGRQLLVSSADVHAGRDGGKDDVDDDDELERLRLLKFLSAKRSHELFMGAGFHQE